MQLEPKEVNRKADVYRWDPFAPNVMKNPYLSAQFRRLTTRLGKKSALVAVGHSILVIA